MTLQHVKHVTSSMYEHNRRALGSAVEPAEMHDRAHLAVLFCVATTYVADHAL